MNIARRRQQTRLNPFHLAVLIVELDARPFLQSEPVGQDHVVGAECWILEGVGPVMMLPDTREFSALDRSVQTDFRLHQTRERVRPGLALSDPPSWNEPKALGRLIIAAADEDRPLVIGDDQVD